MAYIQAIFLEYFYLSTQSMESNMEQDLVRK